MHSTSAPVLSRVVALAATCMSFVCVNASAQTAPVTSAPSAPAASVPLGWYPLSTRVRDLDDTHTRYAVSFGSFETRRVSGTVALWAGDRRYDVPFRNVRAVDSRDATLPPGAVVVRFPAPIALDGAVVTSIEDGGTMRPCEPWFSPWLGSAPLGVDRRTAEQRRAAEQFLADARTAVALDAPAPVADVKPCTTPNRPGRTVRPIEPDTPRFAGSGISVVEVVLDPSDKIVNTRILRSAGNSRLDEAAVSAARASEFEGQTFRCRRVAGSYLFSVEFGR